ncbi:AAA family ATPase [Paucibacter sediminis]|uniref:AAA family ATPase n=1 Tax=Paucibacter sediminis TaxID=3019553 RepID=A0AA95NEU3_9BURK|nr:ExeA family protein [Paucibacter sp. S2-9]WIT13767.1 AAA family ATPase [Paucibacter sp. S2-9]
MYAKFFGLGQEPFSIAPDPRYLFMSERHREALAHLLYGLRGGGGFVLLTGEIGAGKTTVCRCFLEQIPPRCNVAYIFNPKLSVIELLKTVCEEFHIPHVAPTGDVETVKQYLDPLNEFLLRTHAVGQNNVLIIDEAQNLSAEVLEQLRLLTNLETSERKLLQIILIGQPELRSMVAQPALEQLAQRVIARFHLQALSAAETAQYVRHRLEVSGLAGPAPFDAAALRRVHQLARGVPRRINLLCDRALLGAYAQGQRQVKRATLNKAAAEVFDQASQPSQRPMRWVWVLGLALAAAGASALLLRTQPSQPQPPEPQPAMPRPAPTASAASAATLAAAAPAAPALAGRISLAWRGEHAAWQDLAPAWKTTLPPDEPDACRAFRSARLACFRSEGGLAVLRLLDRPAILTLRDGAGQPSYVTLVQLGAQSATVRAGGSSETVSLSTLARQWQGEFATLWRWPEAYAGKLGAGQDASWLAAALAKAADEPAQRGPSRYDAALQARIAAFQRAQGLKVDGLIGPITLMQLNRAAGVQEPRLDSLQAAAP